MARDPALPAAVGFLTHRLTGRFVDSAAAQVGYLPFDYRRFRWAAPGDWRWTVAPIDPAWLPELVPPTARLGELTAAAAEATGLPVGLPVIAAAADKACEVARLGGHHAGHRRPSRTARRRRSTRRIDALRRSHPARPAVPVGRARVPGRSRSRSTAATGWSSGSSASSARPRSPAPRAEGVAPEILFDELVASVPPGSMGLTLQPYWSPGVRIPGPEAKGAIIGFGDVHTRAHVYRAILEGLAYALRDGLERTARRTGVPPDVAAHRRWRLAEPGRGPAHGRRVRAAGGAGPHPRGVRPRGGHRRGGRAGLHPDVPAAVAAMVHVGEVRDPDLAVHARYDELYRSVYRPMYGRLQPLYREIRRITGYPPAARAWPAGWGRWSSGQAAVLPKAVFTGGVLR